jgi:hypothetical protein
MEDHLRKVVISLLLTVLAILAHQSMAVAAAGSVSSPLGVVLQANHAQVGASSAVTGDTLFDGDSLATENGGTLQVRFGGSQAYFLAQSSAVLHQAGTGFGATLTSGTVVLSSQAGETFHLVADGASIRPATTQPTVGQVTLVSPTELQLISSKGSLEVSLDGETKTLLEGQSVRMLIQPVEEASAPDPQGSAASWSSTTTYSKGDVVSYNGGLYTSAVDNNLNHVPGTNSFWGKRRGGGGGNNGSGAQVTGRNRFLWIFLGLAGAGVAIALAVAFISPSKP